MSINHTLFSNIISFGPNTLFILGLGRILAHWPMVEYLFSSNPCYAAFTLTQGRLKKRKKCGNRNLNRVLLFIESRTAEELFVNQKIKIFIAMATLAWGVNFPTHLGIINDTEYYDGKSRCHLNMPMFHVPRLPHIRCTKWAQLAWKKQMINLTLLLLYFSV
jgi:hypothetical protein